MRMNEEEIKQIKQSFEEAEERHVKEDTLLTFRLKVDKDGFYRLNHLKKTGRDDWNEAEAVLGKVTERLYFASKNKNDEKVEKLLREILTESGVYEVEYTISETGEKYVITLDN